MASRISITFLGTGDSVPSFKRNHPGILLDFDGEHLLFDCGEGTQRQFRKARRNPSQVTRIFLSHWHGDHVLGLPGMLQTLALTGHQKKVHIYGPKRTEEFVERMLSTFVFVDKFALEVHEITRKGVIVDEDDFMVEAELMTHGTPALAYKFTQKGHRRIDKIKLHKLKIEAGKHLQALKEGTSITYKGKKYAAKDLTYQDESHSVSIVMDTAYNEKIIPFVKGSDVLISECTFGQDLADQAEEKRHMTTAQVAKIAKQAKVGKLYLTHISSRYERQLQHIKDEVSEKFSSVHVPKDLDTFSV